MILFCTAKWYYDQLPHHCNNIIWVIAEIKGQMTKPGDSDQKNITVDHLLYKYLFLNSDVMYVNNFPFRIPVANRVL